MSDKEMEYYKFLHKWVMIRNSISLICFTVLAIVFNHWYIVFFALIFLSFVNKEEK